MRVLVTGGQGCIGAWVIKLLLERGIDVLMYDVNSSTDRLSLIMDEIPRDRLRIQSGAIEDTARVKSLVADEQVTHIVHLAAVLMPFCQANPVHGGLINVIGTLNLFEAARDAGRPVRITYASSSAVWGPPESYGDRSLTEEDAPRPATHYGVFKHANEENARVFFQTSGISSIGLRPWTVYGVGRDTGLTADPSLALRSIALNQPFQIRLSGRMDLQYVEDVAETFIRCLLSDVEGAHVFNLAGEIVEMNTFIHAVEQLRPKASGLLTSDGPQVPVAYRMDDSQLRRLIRNIPKTDLQTGIEKTLAIFDRLARDGRITSQMPS